MARKECPLSQVAGRGSPHVLVTGARSENEEMREKPSGASMRLANCVEALRNCSKFVCCYPWRYPKEKCARDFRQRKVIKPLPDKGLRW